MKPNQKSPQAHINLLSYAGPPNTTALPRLSGTAYEGFFYILAFAKGLFLKKRNATKTIKKLSITKSIKVNRLIV